MAIRRFFINAKSYRVHVVCWLVFMLYENLLLVGLELKTPDFIALFVHAVANITFFYAFAGMISNWAWRSDQHDWWRIPMGVILSLAVYIIVKVLLDSGIYLLSEVVRNVQLISLKIFSEYLYRGVFFILCAIGYCYLLKFIKERRQREQLLESYFNERNLSSGNENAFQHRIPDFLYTHMNMHHLFSSFNFIYFKLKSYDTELADMVLCTTDLVRYYIDPNRAGKSNLEKELMQIRNLIKMHQIMFPQQAPLHLSVEKRIDGMAVSAFILIPLTVLLLRFSIADRNAKRGELLIFIRGGKLCIKGEEIQHISEPDKLKVEIEKIDLLLKSDQTQNVVFKYQIVENRLNFTLLFEGIGD